MNEATTTMPALTAQALAARISGREYTQEITDDEEAAAKAAGLVVVFGASDDLMEFRGAIHDELGAPAGCDARICRAGLLPAWAGDDDEVSEADAERYFRMKAAGFSIVSAKWAPKDEPDFSWVITTTIPHATFEVVEGEDKFCRGIVFALADVAPDTSPRTQLLDAAKGVVRHMEGRLPVRGWLRDTDHSREDLGRLLEAIERAEAA